ncbi:hypothetical protein [Ammoniphilus resinae]|uniref:Uncharacterized protein n=1 Tax=Ammoniphilus resinae TaxID=861532 RepID=A0ABS4GSU8_9BACL|nr:hypothetical protein [Ammoniphilus resinae]MBP1933362.1 hypothetical protein [Ammoniphilus resinae]
MDSWKYAGILLTSLFQAAVQYNLDSDEYTYGLQDLVCEIEKYTFKTDSIVKELVTKRPYSQDDLGVIEVILSLKQKSSLLNDYVGILLEQDARNCKTLIGLSENLLKTIKECHVLIVKLELDTTSLDLCIDYFKIGLGTLLDAYKEKIIESHQEYLNSHPQQLGLMILQVQVLEKILYHFPFPGIIPLDPFEMWMEWGDWVTEKGALSV